MTLASLLPLESGPHDGKWSTFVNRAGWSISYPRQWRIESCRRCPDPADPDVFVALSDPSTKAIVMIEHLIDMPADERAEGWLPEVSRDTVLQPQLSEEWIVLDNRKALRVTSSLPNGTSTEDIYVLNGRKTFAIRAGSDTPHAIYQRMLSTFKFTVSPGR